MDYKYQRRQIFGKRLKVPKLILNKVYNCTLSFNEYIEYQLDDKIPTSCIIESDRKIVEKFGIDKCKELDWELINKQVYYNKNINFRDVLMSIDSQTQDINSALYELVKDEIKPIDYTPKMREIYSDRLFDVSQNNDENLRYIINDFNEGIIGLKEIIYNWDLFKNKDLSYCLLNDNENKSNITDNILKEFMSSYGELASLIVENYDIYTFISDISSLKSEEEKKNFVKQFTDDILSNTKRKYGDYRLPIKPTDEQYKEIFKYSSMEEYFKTIDQYSAPLIIEELKSLPSDFIFNTSIPFTEILDNGVMHFIGVFGLKNVVDFNDECGEFFTKNNCKMLNLMYDMYLHYAGNEQDRQKNIYCDKDGNYIKGKFTKDQFYESMKRMILYGPSDWNYADKAPDYRNITGEFRVRNSELFISEQAPEELKEVFYTSNTPLTFEFLRQHKDWLPYLEGKNILLRLKKRNIGIRGLEQLFEKYGEQEALRIGMKNPESVMQMLSENKFDVLSDWYDKLHFVPHHVVMKEFPFEQADKFVASGKKWSQLMRIERHNINEDSKAALLKASMCFGVFDNDMDGFNKTMQLFSDIPKTLSSQDMQRMIDFIQKQISSLGDNPDPKMVEDYNKQLALIQQCYGQNVDGIYSLKINSQQNKNIVQTLRNIMEEANVSTILTADKAHKLFGAFAMKYDPDFRDFILKNMDTILSSDEYISYISSMQKQWSEIRAINSNLVLTLDLAMAYVKSNSYTDIQVGNIILAEKVSERGYNQQDFERLQQIYNYAKMRVFSTIPRVHFETDEYICEMIRLDDPMALVIGKLTDCCQELGNAAESCMTHSAVDKTGRIFYIRDKEGRPIAQSWVWRNQNVLCFDNIEIPEKAFTNAVRNGISREQFTDTIYVLYQRAAQELMEKDEVEFRKLLEEGKITEEQYEALKLGKVTVGTGYNDIKESLKRNAVKDSGKLVEPLPYTSPINGSHHLYDHDHLEGQYIVAGKQDVIASDYEVPAIYSDEFVIHDNSNTKQQDVLMLQKLELTTKGDSYSGRTQSDETDKIVSDIAYNYGLNPETTRIIMNANFAIIYDTTNEEVIVGDILYNTSFINQGQQVDITDKVAMQIRMAIEQIGVKGKKFNISRLSQEQLEMCNKAMNLETEIDEERGLSHGAR